MRASPDSASSEDPYLRALDAANALRARQFGKHDVVLVLGSGWLSVLDSWPEPLAGIPMSDVPGFVAPVAEGQGHEIRSYHVGGMRVLVLLGRTHLYEGRGVGPVAHGVRTAAALGCRTAVLTNANGSLRADWAPGTCVLVSDHLNLSAVSPLVGPRFVDLTSAYTPRLREHARRIHPEFAEGIYAMLPGPHYQTRCEGGMLAHWGADVVGMSTVLEVIAARELDLEVLALSLVAVAEGLDTGVDPSQVVEMARQSARALGPVLAEIIGQLEGQS
ncbi:MAG: purine-nucleoside phosphorylase [Nocardioidaceae bacterium]|nr:purine-nucleoside phosphorylase [Nocardioidaceae bacterium]